MPTQHKTIKVIPGEFYIAVNDSPLSESRSNNLDVTMRYYERRLHVYEFSDHMMINSLDEIKLSLKYRSPELSKTITLKEATITVR